MKPIFTDAMAGPEIRRALNDMAGQFEQAMQEAVGPKGWSPVIVAQASGVGRVVLRVTDWTGGEGEKPTATGYIGPAGLVDDAAEAVNIMGAPGAKGQDGQDGQPGQDGQDGQPGQDGADGPANTLSIGTVQAGDAAAASLTGDAPAQTLHLVLPRGPAGINGEDGQDGQAATITIGQVTTLPPGQSATVVNSGTANAAVLDFALPAGRDGSGAVISVNGKDGAVVLAAGDIEGLATIAATGQWADLEGKPAALAAGDTPEQARAAIGAGASNLTLGDGPDQAKPGNWQPAWDAVQGRPAVIAAGDTQQAAREAIGAGTSSLELGSAASQAKPGNWQPGWDEVTGKPAVLAAGDSAEAARAAIGAGTSSLPDAPSDGQSYARRNGQWTPAASSGGALPVGAGSVFFNHGQYFATPAGQAWQHGVLPYNSILHDAANLPDINKIMFAFFSIPGDPVFTHLHAEGPNIYAATSKGEVWLSADDGVNWNKKCQAQAGFSEVRGFFGWGGTLFMCSNKGVYRSDDGGSNWSFLLNNSGKCSFAAIGEERYLLLSSSLFKFAGDNLQHLHFFGSPRYSMMAAANDHLLLSSNYTQFPLGMFNPETGGLIKSPFNGGHACSYNERIFYIRGNGFGINSLYETTDIDNEGQLIGILGENNFRSRLFILDESVWYAEIFNSEPNYANFNAALLFNAVNFAPGATLIHCSANSQLFAGKNKFWLTAKPVKSGSGKLIAALGPGLIGVAQPQPQWIATPNSAGWNGRNGIYYTRVK